MNSSEILILVFSFLVWGFMIFFFVGEIISRIRRKGKKWEEKTPSDEWYAGTEKCGWYGGEDGPPRDSHWHCYCQRPKGHCEDQIKHFHGVHLPNDKACPHGKNCGFTF